MQRSAVVLTKETIKETAKLLELSLMEHLQSNGYPCFSDVEREFSDLSEIDDNLYFLEETLHYANGESYKNKIFLTVINNKWKIAMTE